MDKTGKILYTVKAATVDGQYITSGSWNQSVTEDNGGKVTVSVPLKAGDKIYFGTVNYTTLSPAAQKALNDNLTKAGASIKASYGYGAEQVIINRRRRSPWTAWPRATMPTWYARTAPCRV